MKKIIYFLLFIAFILLLFAIFNFKRENMVLEKAITQYKEEVKQKEEQIQQLQGMLDTLMSKQAIIEKGLQEKRKKKESIIKEVANLKADEVCNEFKKLGYSPVCH